MITRDQLHDLVVDWLGGDVDELVDALAEYLDLDEPKRVTRDPRWQGTRVVHVDFTGRR